MSVLEEFGLFFKAEFRGLTNLRVSWLLLESVCGTPRPSTARRHCKSSSSKSQSAHRWPPKTILCGGALGSQ
uniref:Uncharacterized protein n=1 Tax=Lepeophtheirus salmonis TaxID=72036 RepID=A0A0K2THV9_LEPSM